MNRDLMSISVVIPVLNEMENLESLHGDLLEVLEKIQHPYEIIYCDDGSRDGSIELLQSMALRNQAVKAIFLRKNFGQTAAITAGIDHAQGDIIVLMDADNQNDPNDIPKLLEKMNEGFDIVSGWRKDRKDPYLSKKLPSKIANWIVSKVTGVDIHDSGCTLKAYRREILEGVSLYGEMHRFIPVYGHWQGANVGEVVVNHRPRTKGVSKYSLTRTFKVLLDLPVLILLGNFLTRPIHFFGAIGFGCGIVSFISIIMVIIDKVADPLAKAHRNPMLLMAVFFALAAMQMVMMGLLAELLTRVYHESQDKKTYVIKETMNLED